MGALDGGIQALFGTAFGVLYLDGTLVRVTLTSDGQGGGTATPTPQSCKLQVDACTEAMRAQAGYTDKDVRIIVLQSGVTGGDIDTDCKIIARGVTYDVAWVTQDPAVSYWECRATPSATA